MPMPAREPARHWGYKALTKYHFKEAIPAGVHFAKTQGGHGSQTRTGIIVGEIAKYGTAAREAIPGLRELIKSMNQEVAENRFPRGLNGERVSALEDAIRKIEAATTQPELRTIKTPADGNSNPPTDGRMESNYSDKNPPVRNAHDARPVR